MPSKPEKKKKKRRRRKKRSLTVGSQAKPHARQPYYPWPSLRQFKRSKVSQWGRIARSPSGAVLHKVREVSEKAELGHLSWATKHRVRKKEKQISPACEAAMQPLRKATVARRHSRQAHWGSQPTLSPASGVSGGPDAAAAAFIFSPRTCSHSWPREGSRKRSTSSTLRPCSPQHPPNRAKPHGTATRANLHHFFCTAPPETCSRSLLKPPENWPSGSRSVQLSASRDPPTL